MSEEQPTLDPSFQSASAMEAILRNGHRLHAFLSGGGLRVVRIERVKSRQRRGDLAGYGEHPYLEQALNHAAEDHAAGGRPYLDVYGGKHPHYLTGSCTPSSQLDAHVRRGASFDAFYLRGWFRVELHSFVREEYPKEILSRAFAGETVEWSSPRGVRFRFDPEGCGCTIRVVSNLFNRETGLYQATQRGMGLTLMEAIESALCAEYEDATAA